MNAETIQATFEQIGLRSKKRVAEHILHENTYDSNLVSDISEVCYTKDHLGKTRLQSVDGFPLFVDDIYVYGYFQKSSCIQKGGRIELTQGDAGQARNKVVQVQTCVNGTIGKNMERPYVRVIHTVLRKAEGIVVATVDKIEARGQVLKKWKKIFCEEPYGIVVMKIDVSGYDISDIHENISSFERILGNHNMGLYSIDYTQDFSGTLDRNALVEHLTQNHGFYIQGTFLDAMQKSTEHMPIILDNTSSVGNNVCTWISTNKYGDTVRTKIYNKVVSQFETGEVYSSFGGNLANYVNCSQDRLRRLFTNPEIQKRGCTRIETSLYASKNISISFGKATIDEAFKYVDRPLFCIQPTKKQYSLLAERIDRCTVIADRPCNQIYVCWYGHSVTGKLTGVKFSTLKEVWEDSNKWERAILWAASCFGFRECPIFRIDILENSPEGCTFSRLKCYWKPEDTYTILCISGKPTQLQKFSGDVSDILPPTKYIEWKFREKKVQNAIGKEKPMWNLEEVDTSREISLLSKRRRGWRQEEIAEQGSMAVWQNQVSSRKLIQEEEVKHMREAIQAHREHVRNMEKIQETVYSRFNAGFIQFIKNFPAKTLFWILGFRKHHAPFGKSARAVVRIAGPVQYTGLENIDSSSNIQLVWATKELYRVLCFLQDNPFYFRKKGTDLVRTYGRHSSLGNPRKAEFVR